MPLRRFPGTGSGTFTPGLSRPSPGSEKSHTSGKGGVPLAASAPVREPSRAIRVRASLSGEAPKLVPRLSSRPTRRGSPFGRTRVLATVCHARASARFRKRSECNADLVARRARFLGLESNDLSFVIGQYHSKSGLGIRPPKLYAEHEAVVWLSHGVPGPQNSASAVISSPGHMASKS